LPVEGLVDLFQLGLEASQIGGVLMLDGACGAGEFAP
jgi:hypothetical protein